MLIEVSVCNFLSFKEKTTLSLVPGKGRNLSEHIIHPEDRKDIKALKSSLLFGANASGKSNFIKAILFAQQVILSGGIQSLSINERKVFRLNPESKSLPSEFSFLFKISHMIFEYSFKLNDSVIVEEKLIEIKKTTEDVIFFRTALSDRKVQVLFEDFHFENQGERKRIEYIAKDTLPEKLFLYELNSRNLTELSHFELLVLPFKWFKENLVIILPETKLLGLELKIIENSEISKTLTKFLRYFDTGIMDIQIQEIELEKIKEKIPSEMYNKIIEEIKTRGKVIINLTGSLRYAIIKESDTIKSYKLMMKHSTKNNSDILFEFSEESDGTQRLFDLIPGLEAMNNLNRTFIIDEIDRSLHPILTRKFIELFFELTKSNESQLISCTHESILLDQSLFRRDEIWFVEKNDIGESKLYSLSEFSERYDKDIQKGYLVGRFGAVAAIHRKKIEFL
jgi:uncharacterized protein